MPNPIEQLSPEKRMFVAIALCMAVAVLFSVFFAPPPAPPPPDTPEAVEPGPPSITARESEEEEPHPPIAEEIEEEAPPPALPPRQDQDLSIAQSPDLAPPVQEVVIDTPGSRYVFSTQGGTLRSCRLKNHAEIDPPLRLLENQRNTAPTPEAREFWQKIIEDVKQRLAHVKGGQYIPKGKEVPEKRWMELIPPYSDRTGWPLRLRFGKHQTDESLVYETNLKEASVGPDEPVTLELVGKTGSGLTIKKTLFFTAENPAFEITIETEAPGGVEELRKTFGAAWSLEWPDGLCHMPFHYPGAQEENAVRALLKDSMESQTFKAQLLKNAYTTRQTDEYRHPLDSDERGVRWVNIETRYFLTTLVPQLEPMDGVYIVPRVSAPTPFDAIDTRLGIGLLSPFTDGPRTIAVYAGPKVTHVLQQVGIGLDWVVYDSWFETIDKICRFVGWLLSWFYGFIPNYGVAIILLCIFSKIALYPLTYKQAQTQKKMAILQPKIAELKEKHKDNPQKLQQEQMKLWKKHGVNPVGCLPMFAQLPIFLALYKTINADIDLRGAPFLWVDDLSVPDMTFFLPVSLPFLGNAVNVLPFLMTVISVMQMQQQKKTMPDPNQAQIMVIMTGFFFFILYHFSSGLVLYWMTNSLTMWMQQKIMERVGHAHTPAERAALNRKQPSAANAAPEEGGNGKATETKKKPRPIPQRRQKQKKKKAAR